MIDYNKILNPTAAALKPSGIRRFFDISEQMENVISLGVGEPDFQTPWHIRHAGIESLEGGKTRYTANRGMEPLRKEIANYTKRRFNLTYDPNEVLVRSGDGVRKYQEANIFKTESTTEEKRPFPDMSDQVNNTPNIEG